jgi:hypothetical protein
MRQTLGVGSDVSRLGSSPGGAQALPASVFVVMTRSRPSAETEHNDVALVKRMRDLVAGVG